MSDRARNQNVVAEQIGRDEKTTESSCDERAGAAVPNTADYFPSAG